MQPDTAMAAMDIRLEYPEVSSLEAGLGADRLNLDALFPDRAGRAAKRHNQRRMKDLTQDAPLLTRMLWEGEVIEYAAKGVYASSAEMMMSGVWARFANHHLILLTNHRLVFINTDTKGNPKRMFLHQARFDRIKSVKAGWFGNFQFKLTDGKTVLFQNMNKLDRTALKGRLDQRLDMPAQAYAPAGTAETGPYENLCTNCFRVVPAKTYLCPFCRTEFRTPGQAALRSLVIPGWGDLYMKQGFLAVLRMVAVPFIYLAIAVASVQDPDLGPVALIPVVLFIVLFNALSAGVTYLVSRKGLVPMR